MLETGPLRSRHRMSADEAYALRDSRFDNHAFGADDVGDGNVRAWSQRVENVEAADRRRGKHEQIARLQFLRTARCVDDTSAQSLLDDRLIVPRRNREPRDRAAQRKRHRAANQPEAGDDNAAECQRPQPLRATGSTQMLRPIAGAMMRSSAI